MVTLMVTHRALATLAFAALFFAASAAFADDPPTAPDAVPPSMESERAPAADAKPAPPRVVDPSWAAIHHTPISSAPASEPLTIEVTIDSPHLLSGAGVVYRTGDQWFYVKLLRTDTAYAATIPAEHMKAPGIGYAIEMEYLDGKRAAVFASRAELHPVVVIPDRAETRESLLLQRYEGRRSLVTASGEFVRFGYDTLSAVPCGAKQSACEQGKLYKPTVDDQYWRVEGSYTYRPLHVVEQFGFRVGVMRGTRPIYTSPPSEYTAKAYEVGVNYAGAEVRFRAASILHFDLSTLGSVTEVGFSFGAGAQVMLGDPLGTRFSLGWQTIGVTRDTYFGTRFYVRLDLPVTQRFELGPSIEVTDMPHAETFGVRLLADATIGLGRGFALGLRGGYQARVSRSGGPTAGATLQLGF